MISRKMLRVLAVALVGASLSTQSWASDVANPFDQGVKLDLVTSLDRGEPYDPMVSQDGLLWVGRSRQNFNSYYRIDLFDGAGQPLASTQISHAMSTMKVAGSKSVIVTGVSPDTQLTRYTKLTWDGSRIVVKTTEIALGGFITHWIGSVGQTQYFADMGGNPNDTEIQKPAQTIFTASPSRATYLPTRVRMPLASFISGQSIYIHSGIAIGSRSGKIVAVDLRTKQVKPIVETLDGDLSTLSDYPASNAMISLVRTKGALTLFDKATGAVQKEFFVDGYARSHAVVGHCVVVGSEGPDSVAVFDLNAPSGSPAIASASLGLSFEEFSGMKKVAADLATGSVFVRSNYPCNPMVEECASDNNRVLKVSGSISDAIKSQCR